jgi:hypothetical protein
MQMNFKQTVFKWLKFKANHTNTLTSAEYVQMLNGRFSNREYAQYLIDELIVHICVNNFSVSVGDVLVRFKSSEFTVDEYFLLMYKFGGLVQMFAEHPNIYLERALDYLSHRFTSDQLYSINQALENYYHNYDVKLHSLIALNNEVSEEALNPPPPPKRSDENSTADFLIDEWLKSQRNGNIQ